MITDSGPYAPLLQRYNSAIQHQYCAYLNLNYSLLMVIIISLLVVAVPMTV